MDLIIDLQLDIKFGSFKISLENIDIFKHKYWNFFMHLRCTYLLSYKQSLRNKCSAAVVLKKNGE